MIRFFCLPTTLALNCVLAMLDDGHTVRIILQGGFQPEIIGWRQDELVQCLTVPVTDPYINVVCGDAEMIKKLWTAGVVNVAVTPDEAPGYDHCVFEPAELVETLRCISCT